jgi:beta-phosphoglucomutase-like phosphatase (HAD superfamily)
MLKAILWDNDGGLVDTEGLYFQACRDELAAQGIAIDEADFAATFLKSSEGIRAFVGDLDKAKFQALRTRRNGRYSALLRRGVEPIAGVEEALKKLRGKVRMGVVTSSRGDHFEMIHASSGLLPYFDFVLVREDYGESKPDPERGLLAAVAAGIRCAVIPQGLTRTSDFSQAYAVLNDIGELAPLALDMIEEKT